MNSKKWERFKCVICGKIWRRPHVVDPIVANLCEECWENPKEPPPEIRDNPFVFEHEI